MRRRLGLSCAAALVLAGCGGGEERGGAAIQVAVGIAPHAWLVEQVGGERVSVFELVRPGESPETYQPADHQVTRLLRSAVYFRAGVPFEGSPWFDAVERTGGVAVVDLRRGIEPRPMTRHLHGAPDHGNGAAGGDDPHTWLSPKNLEIQARTVATTLARLDPGDASGYQTRLADLERRLDALDRDLRRTLEPLLGRPFFVFHPAWGHFADAYGLRQVAIEVEGKEPSDRELTELQQLAREAGARVVFVQPQVSARTAEAVARAVGARVETLDPLARDVEANLRRVAEALRAAL